MSEVKKIYAVIPLVAATVAIIVAIVGGISLKNENALLRNELARAEEKNRSLFVLLVKFIKQGNLSLIEISPFVSTSEAKDLTEKATQAIKSSLPFDLETEFYPSGWMGDGKFGTKYLSLKHEKSILNGKDIVATKIEYARVRINGPASIGNILIRIGGRNRAEHYWVQKILHFMQRVKLVRRLWNLNLAVLEEGNTRILLKNHLAKLFYLNNGINMS